MVAISEIDWADLYQLPDEFQCYRICLRVRPGHQITADQDIIRLLMLHCANQLLITCSIAFAMKV